MTKATYTYNSEHYDRLLKSVRGCVAKTPKAAITHLQTKVVAFLTAKAESTSGADKKLFEKSHNLVTSYIEGLKSGDIELRELKTLGKEMEEAKVKHERVLAEAAAKAEAKAAKQNAVQSSGSSSGDDTPIEVLLNERPGMDHGEGAAEIYKKYKKWQREMPRSTKKPYIAVRMPILVIPNGIPDQLRLQRTGLCDDLLFGYPILKNQVLIGLNFDWLKDNFAKKAKVNIRNDGKQDFNLDYEAAMSKILAEVKQRTGRSYLFMSGIHGFDSTDIHWAWIASEMDLRRLNGTTGTSTFSVKEWTLPFENQTRKLKRRA